jgi:O-antigen/teichoic acid export membrane protein
MSTPKPLSRRRSSAFFFIGQMSSFGFVLTQGLLLVPLYLRFIDITLYGAWLATVQAIGWATLIDPGTDEAMRQRLAHSYGSGRADRVGLIIGAGIVVNIAAAALVTLASLAITPFLASWFGLMGASAHALTSSARILALASGLTVLGYAPGSALVALQRAGGHAVVSCCGAVAGIIVNLYLLSAGWGVGSIAWGIFSRALVWAGGWCLLLVWINRQEHLHLRISFQETCALIRFSAYTMIAKIAQMAQNSIDGFLAGALIGPAHAVTLLLTGRTIDTIRIVPDRIGSAVQPSLAHLVGEGDRRKIKDVSLQFVTLMAITSAPLIATGVIMNRAVMTAWVGHALYGGYWLTLLLGASACISVVINSAYHVLFAHGLIPKAAKLMVSFALLKVALTILLLRWAGLLAVPLGLLGAAVLVGCPRFLRATAEALGLDRSGRRKALLDIFAPAALCFLAASAFCGHVDMHGWGPVIAAGAGLGAVLGSCVLVLRPDSRQIAVRILRTKGRLQPVPLEP